MARPVTSSLEGDAVARPAEAQLDAVVDQALALQPLADARLASRSTVPCSSTPARTRRSTYSRLRLSSTTESMPRRWSRWDSSSPAGPAPMIPTWVRMAEASCLQPAYAAQASFH